MILTTNDDGIQSPLLAPLLNSLKLSFSKETINFVVPDRERSWISQAITRREPVKVSETEFEGFNGFTSTGYPADCTNLGIDNLFETKPRLVVSGINIGMNAGLAYYLYSGTVGAARAAFLRGVRGIALSLAVPEEIYTIWNSKDLDSFEPYRDRFIKITNAATNICQKLDKNIFWSDVDFYNINLPWDADLETEVKFCPMNRFFIGKVFVKQEDGTFAHRFEGVTKEIENSEADHETVDLGHIAVSPVRYDSNSLIPEDLLSRISSDYSKGR